MPYLRAYTAHDIVKMNWQNYCNKPLRNKCMGTNELKNITMKIQIIRVNNEIEHKFK